MRLAKGVLCVVLALSGWPLLRAQQEHHDHGEAAKTPVEKPRVFLDKSPRIVRYQLKRLDNARLLLVERGGDDRKYAPVHEAILTREGMSLAERERALAALVEIRKTSVPAELFAALELLDPETGTGSARSARQLAGLLLRSKSLEQGEAAVEAALASENPIVRGIAAAAGTLLDQEEALARARASKSAAVDWLRGVELLEPALRDALADPMAGWIAPEQPVELRRAAVRALRGVSAWPEAQWARLLPLLADEALRPAVVRTLLAFDATVVGAKDARPAVEGLVARAEKTPEAERTTREATEALELADRLLARLAVEDSRAFRARLREVAVRVVRILTVEEEMRYDKAWFAVEAGRPVQIVLENHDLMAHNLVVTAPGKLQEVAEAGLRAGPAGTDGKGFVPASEDVLQATHMVQPGQEERLTFTAPEEPGEYPYVCTFPQHWPRMYGVMVVVKDLDAWLQNPLEPKDPLGLVRPFVKFWELADFPQDLASALAGRSAELGARLFREATCANCHRVRGEGGQVGPALDGVLARLGDDRGLLREILEPSHRIEPAYVPRVVTTKTGRVVSGLVRAEDKKTISILENPESTELTVLKRRDILVEEATSVSMMPKGLLDRFQKEEVLEILAWLRSLPPAK